MIKQYFKQALAQLRQHPLISVISIAGTALSIFLIMLVVMLQQVKVAPFSPESNRNRFLHVHYMSISHKDWGDGTSNGPMSVRTAREVYKSLKTPESCHYLLQYAGIDSCFITRYAGYWSGCAGNG